MRSIAAYLFSLLVFAIGTAFLWFGRHSLGESSVLLFTILGCYLVALGTAFPADMDKARQQLVAWYQAWKAK